MSGPFIDVGVVPNPFFVLQYQNVPVSTTPATASTAAPATMPNSKRPSELPLHDFGRNVRRNNHMYDYVRTGRASQATFLVADEGSHGNTLVFETAFSRAKLSTDFPDFCGYFASMVCAFSPNLKDVFINALDARSIKVDYVSLPSQAAEHYIYEDAQDHFDEVEVMTILRSSLLLIFKNITPENYSSFVTKRVQAIAGKLGVNRKQITKLRCPFSIEQAEHLRNVFGCNSILKKEILNFLMYHAQNETLLGSLCRYCCVILSWNELTVYVFIFQKLCCSRSPVMSSLAIQHEVLAFSETMIAILKSEVPQFFRYFCTGRQEILLARSRISVLGKVANILKDEEVYGSSSRNFVSTLEKSDGLVNELVTMHKRYVAECSMGAAHTKEFLCQNIRIMDIENEDDT